jgi:hypothetical protein
MIMDDPIATGSWVEIHCIVLPVGQRSAQIPAETRAVALEMRVKGFLVAPACVGDDAEIVTRAGRHLRGTLAAVNPSYDHGFGPPLPELSAVGDEVRALLLQRERIR